MNTWKKIMPDYQIKRWNKQNFDINSVSFVREAYEEKQWASAADYIRLYALYNEGGIYLDSDVVALKPFDIFLSHDFFTATEYHPKVNPDAIGIQAAIFGSVAGHPYLKSCMDFLENRCFIHPDGSYDNEHIIAPGFMAQEAEKFNFEYKDELQVLPYNMVIYPSATFLGSRNYAITPEAYALHKCEGSWRKRPWYKRLFRKIKDLF
jgi:hypothetical protein